ncbi:MAG TPA: HRDC domain-containing protein, partial [Pirellulaceae bacterium]
MRFRTIDQPAALDALCSELRDAPWIAFDTEFVSEYSYAPQLCLIQVGWPQGLAVIDPLRLPDVSPFWQRLVVGEHVTIVHAGREEARFCHRATKAIPHQWFDVQLAGGFVTSEYPSSYLKLAQRWLNRSVNKDETRTDWRKRPLTPAQLEYALGDVRYLPDLRDALEKDLRHRGRESWFIEESSASLAHVTRIQDSNAWQRLSGGGSLKGKARNVLSEIWTWREELALHRNCSPRRILRDDLLVEIARRGRADEAGILAIRGVRPDLKRDLPSLQARMELALSLPTDPAPAP